MSKQPNTIDSLSELIASEAARPPGFRAKLAARHEAASATLEKYNVQPLESDLDQVLAAQGVKLAAAAMLESFDSIPIENRQRTLADAAALSNKAAGVESLETELAARLKPRPAKMAQLGRETASVQEAMFAPDLPHAELVALEARRAKLVDDALYFDTLVASARNTIARFSNVPSAETWADAVRAVRAVDFS